MPSQVDAFSSYGIEKRKIKPGFEWSLRPLIICNRCIGIQLDFPFCSEIKSYSMFQQSSWWLITIFGFVLFFLNTEFHLTQAGDYIYNSVMTKNKSTIPSTVVWNNVIDLSNTVVTLVGTHAIIIATSMINWRQLAKFFLVMEQRNLFDEKNYQTFRRISFSGVLVFTTVSHFLSGIVIPFFCSQYTHE